MMMKSMHLFIFTTFIVLFFNTISMAPFKVGTLNVNGAREASKRALVFDTVRTKHIDVVVKLEVRIRIK